ncbi:MAG: hypothetical protein IJ081_05795 [Prevotella sp.]|nr:hypothetical protein [Prevotella sp.]
MRRTIIILSLLNTIVAGAQEESAYRYADATELWRNTQNAAGMSLDSAKTRGFASFTLQHKSGSYHRVQEGGQQNLLRFESERYQPIGKYLVGYGHFSFEMDRTKDRRWADVFDPYNGNPYFPGSDVNGKYDRQAFDFTGSIGTQAIGNFRFGLRLDYQVADLSRLRDPRSRSQLLEYQLTPAITYTIGKHSLGLSPYYHRRKEKMPSLTTVQNDPNLAYYEMRGLEQAYGSIGAYKGFNRQWVDHRLGFSLNYGIKTDFINSLTAITLERGEEDILEKEKREPAHYATRSIGVNSQNRIKSGSLLHEADLRIDYQQAYGDEYTQQRMQTTDAETGVTSYYHETVVAYEKRYQAKRLNAQLRYRLNFTEGQQTKAYVGLLAQMATTNLKHKLPSSTFDYNRYALTVEGGKTLLNNKLWIDVNGGYHFTNTKDEDLQLAEPNSVYAQQVLLPDMAYYTANYWQAHLQLTYAFPLHIKSLEAKWFVRAYGDYLKTNNSLDNKCVGISIGILN